MNSIPDSPKHDSKVYDEKSSCFEFTHKTESISMIYNKKLNPYVKSCYSHTI